jgi:hypothetical protein
VEDNSRAQPLYEKIQAPIIRSASHTNRVVC